MTKRVVTLTAGAALITAALVGAPLTAHAAPAPVTVAFGVERSAETYQERMGRALDGVDAPDHVKAQVRAVTAALPADADQRLEMLDTQLGLDHTVWSEIVGQAINPEDYECASTPLGEWSRAATSDWNDLERLVYVLTPIGPLPTYDALLFGSESKLNEFGAEGEYTGLLNSQMKDLRSFWDIDGSKIQLIPMHGADVFSSIERLSRILKVAFTLSDDDALKAGTAIKELMDLLPAYQGGAHPIFSFNAFAVDATGEEGAFAGIGKRIVMGDGVMQGFDAIGIDTKVAPRAILAHEYGHQVQFMHGLIDPSQASAEGTRRTELMADALATYFMVHARGEALNAQRTLGDQLSFYNVGDCRFDSSGHHGTPDQRFRSAGWAVMVVDSAPNQGDKLASAELITRFDAQLPALVAPDAN
ncbi:hypothetical protein [Agromyces sp. NPDC058104]|uniref:hypothetical protein n=1 Tax=Agromyces sp. NPDC058104 TaxID=3346342 RepID=UPI0036D896B8